MASNFNRLLLSLTILLAVLSISAAARPCRGSFFISSTYSFSLRNPNSRNFLRHRQGSSLTVVTQYNNNPNPHADTIEIFVDRLFRFGRNQNIQELQRETLLDERQKSDYPFRFFFSSQDFTSLRDRTKDILSVVVSLLFGVGCGALAASTVYLIWTLFTHRCDYYQLDSESESDEESETLKEVGYVKVPAGEFVSGRQFICRNITIWNTDGPTDGPQNHQAVALPPDSDQVAFYRCSFKGYQDTLYANQNRQFYRECDIYGAVDFIFGNATAVFQNCNIFLRNPPGKTNVITAQGRNILDRITGFSIHNSIVKAASDLKGAS